MCGTEFTLQDFLASEQLIPIGISFENDDLGSNALFFKHDTAECGTSLAIRVDLLAPLIEETIPSEILFGKDGCEHHCVTMADYADCGQVCHFAPYRRLLVRMLDIRTEAVVGQK
jgi:hypothetical protein